MAKEIPTVSRAHLYDPDHAPAFIRVDTPQWFAWLDAPANTRFSYALHNRAQGYIDGFVTVRKESRQRGGAYWSAYRRQNGKVRKIYLGRTAALTQDRLEEVALRLRDPPHRPTNVTQQP
jgi:LuxR family maltose regulon positive regulatory protein